jgi:hypothetical protein
MRAHLHAFTVPDPSSQRRPVRACTLLDPPIFQILLSEPSARPTAQLSSHRPDERIGAFALEECPARDNIHPVLAPREHDIGTVRAGQKAE